MTLLYASRVFTCIRNLDGVLRAVDMRWTTEELWFDSIKGKEIFRYIVSHWLWGPPDGFRTGGDFFLCIKGPLREADHACTSSTVTRRLTTGIHSEKCVVWRFRLAKVI